MLPAMVRTLHNSAASLSYIHPRSTVISHVPSVASILDGSEAS